MNGARPASAVSNRSNHEGLVASVRRRLARERELLDQSKDQIQADDVTQNLVVAEKHGNSLRLFRGCDEATLVVDRRALFPPDVDASAITDDDVSEQPLQLEIFHVGNTDLTNSISAASMLSALSFAGIWPVEVPRVGWCQVDFDKVVQSSAMLRLDIGSSNKYGPSKPLASGLQLCAMRKNYARKGTHRRFQSTIRPFSDAEVFQLIYLKLMLHSLFNYHFQGIFDDEQNVLSHNIGYLPATCAVCFEGPHDFLVLFPARANLLVPLPLETLHISGNEPRAILGWRGIPCTTSLGCSVVSWAQKRIVKSPSDATKALGEVFALFGEYKTSADAVMSSYTAVKIFRCSARSRRRLLRSCPAVGSLLIVPTEVSNVKVSPTQAIDDKWRKYIKTRSTDIFSGDIREIVTIEHELGKGGSGLVFKGTYRGTKPVAIKCFVQVDGMSHEEYVRECLTDLAFLAIGNQFVELGMVLAVRAYDFVVSRELPVGMTQQQIRHCYHHSRDAKPQMCFLVTDLVDSTLGRFLSEVDADFDPCYDTLQNSPLSFGEFFQLLYVQLTFRAFADYTVHDLMLHGQLRGDNVGFVRLDPSVHDAVIFEGPCGERVTFATRTTAGENLRLIYLIDVGQGLQPQVQTLSQLHYIGQSVVESCLVDDGMGRFWPSNMLYAKDVGVSDEKARRLRDWSAKQLVDTPEEAVTALKSLFAHCVSDSAEKEQPSRPILLSCAPERASKFRQGFVYREV